jgi:NADH pyrophosphatase NudC (nudix superfamily)
MEALGTVVVFLILLVAPAVAILVWRDRRREPVCPWCGEPGTFGSEGMADVCSNCGFDFRKDDY